MKENRMTTKEAASLMGVSETFIRVGLQNGMLPFGFAVKNKGAWCYYISPHKFSEHTGISVEGVANGRS